MSTLAMLAEWNCSSQYCCCYEEGDRAGRRAGPTQAVHLVKVVQDVVRKHCASGEVLVTFPAVAAAPTAPIAPAPVAPHPALPLPLPLPFPLPSLRLPSIALLPLPPR